MMNVTYNDYGLKVRLINFTAEVPRNIKKGLRDASIILERQIVKNLSGRSHARKTFRADTGRRKTVRVRDKETGMFEFKTRRVFGIFQNQNPFPGVVSGDLKRGVGYAIQPYLARIGVLELIPYAAIHEFGGTINRRSSKGKSYRIVIPKRAYIAPAFKEKREAMVAALQNRLLKGLTR